MNGGSMTPSEIVSELDRYIVGQKAAKKAPMRGMETGMTAMV